jgi:hypothetical protein
MSIVATKGASSLTVPRFKHAHACVRMLCACVHACVCVRFVCSRTTAVACSCAYPSSLLAPPVTASIPYGDQYGSKIASGRKRVTQFVAEHVDGGDPGYVFEQRGLQAALPEVRSCSFARGGGGCSLCDA